MVGYLAQNPNIKGSNLANGTSGLYYKHVMIVNDDSSAVNKLSFKLFEGSG